MTGQIRVSLCLCFRVVLQQNHRFAEIEAKYKFLHGKTSSLFDMEEEVLKVSQKVRVVCSEGMQPLRGARSHKTTVEMSSAYIQKQSI